MILHCFDEVEKKRREARQRWKKARRARLARTRLQKHGFGSFAVLQLYFLVAAFALVSVLRPVKPTYSLRIAVLYRRKRQEFT